MTNTLHMRSTELVSPLPDLAAWTACLKEAEIPVLRDTSDSIEAFRAHEDETDANMIGEMIAGDPLMTLKVLAYESCHRGSSVVTSAQTVTSALVMLGIPPFFRAFPPQPAVEDWLADRPDALEGLRRVLLRAHRGANFALAFAIHRSDPHAAVIHAATLLHEFTEMLLWCHAPVLALRVLRAQQTEPALRSDAAQMGILNVDLAELQRSLITEWRLPTLLADLAERRETALSTGARTVFLAARLARHTANDWQNPAIPDDVGDIALLLNLSPAATLEFLQEV